MFRRSLLMAALVAGLTNMTGFPMKPVTREEPTGSRGRRGGKGKGRTGASKAVHAPRHSQRDHGKTARRRRRAAALRRG